MKKLLFELAFAAAFIGGFLLYGDVMMPAINTFFMGMLWVFFGLCALGIAIYLYLKITRKPASSLGITVTPREGESLIGAEGVNLPLAIREDAHGIHVEWGWWNYLLIIAATTFFGPGLAAAYFFFPEKFNDDLPVPIVIAVIGLVLLCCHVCVSSLRKYFFHRPRLAITTAQIQYFEGKALKKTFLKLQIKELALRPHTFIYSPDKGARQEVPNFILTAVMEDGSSTNLCITDRRPQIDQLVSLIKKKDYEVALRATAD